MRLEEDFIKKWITKIGFSPKDGESGIYCKVYPNHDGYTIFIDFNKNAIIYDSDERIPDAVPKVWEKTTSNFSQAENLVVLECVDRLLEKGYAPACIELERTYPSGHGRSGRLDIFVKQSDSSPFLLVECKTWGTEFEKEKSKMLRNGGQLFTYYTNVRAAQFLCLYASHVDDTRERKSAIVDVDTDWRGLSDSKEIYDHWNKNFREDGIFDDFATPYHVEHKARTYGQLNTLKEENSGQIYNRIMEILRHNAISDKPNAFNKLLNLFVCKIIDETDKNPEDELDFQWFENDTDESLQLRLNDLYKKGMWRFLEIKVIDYEQREVTEKLKSVEDESAKQWILKMYTDTRLKKSPNFAFVEVQDDRTFALNARVVREIVKLLQDYKFRYEQKHEFLGNFFEMLLGTSMKQEAGQFFTPVPITRFIISSLPLAKLVQERVDLRADELLPTIIDYACGSGHFLTEYMSQMQEIIDRKIDFSHASPRIKNLFQSWQGYTKFLWAKDSVYGIDLDNRLVKTTKVSAFFNGDGEANIVWANGLDHFTKSETYRGKLKYASGQDNGQFDILISNPPYSVDAFKNTIVSGEESFELYESLTDNSSEIECLFVERMKQLVRIGGWAAVILPSSILSNGGIHAKAREILLKYFLFKAVVELGSGTFMKTGTNTVILFLERRDDNNHKAIKREIDRFFSTKKDAAVDKIEYAFSTYVKSAYDSLPLEDYVSIFSDAPTVTARNHELYLDYQRTYGEGYVDKAITIEKEKMLYFLLAYHQKVVLIKAGKGKEEKKFLGYEFSERRGHEGLHHLPSGTKLYDEADPLNPEKVSSYIYRAFLGETAEVDLRLVENVHYRQLCELIEYGTSKFNQTINLGKRTQNFSMHKYSLVSLSDVTQIFNGGTPDTTKPEFWNGDICWATLVDTKQKYLFSTQRTITEAGLNSCNATLMPINSVLFSSRASIGDVSIAKIPVATNQGYKNFVCNESLIHYEYLYQILKREAKTIESLANGMTYPEISKEKIAQFKIPLPPLDIQQKIVDEIESLERDEEICKKRAQTLQKALLKPEYFQFAKRRIRDISIMVKRGKSAKYGNSNVQIIKSGQACGYLEFDFSEKHFVIDGFILDERKLEKGDILINSTGVGTAGRVTLFELEGDFVVDSHITIVRIDPKQAFPKYVLYALANIGFKQIEAMADGQSGQIELSLDTILSIQIPFPDIDEQKKIVTNIEQCETEISKFNTQLGILKAKKDTILEKYL